MDTPVVLKISSLNLMGRKLPASVGLFKLGSDAYMIGGQDLPGSGNQRRNPRGIASYKVNCIRNGVKGSSRAAYRLSLLAAEGDNDNTPTLSIPEPCGEIEELKEPKVWPIIEKIGDKLHVIESINSKLPGRHPLIFSHEVGDCNGRGWKKIPINTAKKVRIKSHVVVGERLYAVTWEGRKWHNLVFDSKEEKWEGSPNEKRKWGMYRSGWKVKRVWDILDLGIARCAGSFYFGSRQLYVVVAFMRKDTFNAVMAVAYLVTSTGKVICYQKIPGFFENESWEACYVLGGTIVHVDDEEGPLLGRTMCSVISGVLPTRDPTRTDHIFITTFSVEEVLLTDAAANSKLRELLEDPDTDTNAVNVDFVWVAIKARYVLRTHDDSVRYTRRRRRICSEKPHRRRFVDWRSCFLTPPSN